MHRIRSRTERGASAVEFALVLPVLVLVLFGMISTGFAYSDHLSITNAVREGARFGAAIKYTDATWPTSVRDRVKQVYFNEGSQIDNSQICVKLVDSSHNLITGKSWTGAKCGPAPDLDDFDMTAGSCAVVVWVRKPHTIELVVAPNLDFDIGAESISYYGRTVASCSAE